MTFKEDTAGGIMSTDYLALHASMTVAEALVYLREKYEDLEEEIYDVYVVDEEELVGEVTLVELLTAAPEILVKDVMDEDFVFVQADIDQEQAAEILSRYDFYHLPVVNDKQKQLLGIITADDVIDVLKEEAIEDIFQSSGITTGPKARRSQLQRAQTPFPPDCPG
jgi:magnesium transporter